MPDMWVIFLVTGGALLLLSIYSRRSPDGCSYAVSDTACPTGWVE